MVPFKKPLNYHFSVNLLKKLFNISGFKVTNVNHFIDSDILCIIGQKQTESTDQELQKDNHKDVSDFFIWWHKETQDFYIKK